MKLTHDHALIKAKLDNEMLRSMEVKREGLKTHITFVIKPDENLPRTENVELSVKRAENAPGNAAFKFLLNIPNDATVARVE